MNPAFAPLFEPLTLPGGVTLKNRVMLAPMTHMSSNPDGTVSDAELSYYARRSAGAGIVVTACTFVTANGKGFPGQFAADSDDYIPSLKRVADTIKEQGAKAVLQVYHGGRLSPPAAVPGGDVVAPSAVASEREGAVTPRELTEAEIADIVKAFGETTRRAIEAGFDGIEIHGANGYLLQQFFSPHANRREDRYGGSVQNRLTFPLEVVDEITRVVKLHAKEPFIVGYRVSPEEPETPGITMAETFVLLDALAAKPLDYVSISLNEFWAAPRRGTDDTRSRMEIIQERIGSKVPVVGVGAIATAEEAAKARATGVAIIAIGRAFIYEPDWVQKVAEGREEQLALTLKNDARERERLAVPEPLWNIIVGRPGWFPVVD